MKQSPIEIKIAEIIVDPALQAREKLCESTADAYATLLQENPDNWPFTEPVTLFLVDGRYTLVDGWHRIEACNQTGRALVHAVVRTGTKLDALKWALGANATHGLRRSNADKRRSVRLALENEHLVGLSNKKIAKLCGVSNTFVAKVSKEMAYEGVNVYPPDPLVSADLNCSNGATIEDAEYRPTEPASPNLVPASAARQKNKTGKVQSTALSAFEKAYKDHIGPLMRSMDKVRDLNGGPGPVYEVASESLTEFSREFRMMGQGQK